MLHRLLTSRWQGNSLICAADGANGNILAKILPNISLICWEHTENSFCSHMQEFSLKPFSLGMVFAQPWAFRCSVSTVIWAGLWGSVLFQHWRVVTAVRTRTCIQNPLSSYCLHRISAEELWCVLWVSSIFTRLYQTVILYVNIVTLDNLKSWLLKNQVHILPFMMDPALGGL